MKYRDVQKVHEAGLITAEQRQNIIAHFQLKEDGGKFLVIISIVGAVLVAAGVVLLISANWEEIPRGLKIFVGLALMLGAHGAGWWLREGPLTPSRSPSDGERVSAGRARGNFQKTGEALHLLGALLFLGNIALVGQIYHLVSRPPNAFLLWWAGIAALPWLLRSKALHVLTLLAFGLWFGIELNQDDSLICVDDEFQVLAYSLLGAVYLGLGYVLRRGAFASFARVTERLGLVALLAFAYPLTWRGFLDHYSYTAAGSHWILPVLAAVAVVLLVCGARHFELDRQWRWTWVLTLVIAAGLLLAAFYAPHEPIGEWPHEFSALNGIAALTLFVFCLLQIQVGLQERSMFLVNLGVVFIALDIIAAYFGLFGTMARTGLMFVASGVFLIVFGVYLEKKRRKLVKQIQVARSGKEPQP